MEKLNANDHMTQLVGLKYKLSHKRAGKSAWNASGETQRRRLIDISQGLANAIGRQIEEWYAGAA